MGWPDAMICGHYPDEALKADYLRTAAGLALGLAPFLLARPHPLVAVPAAAVLLLFLVYGLRTGLRQFSEIQADDTGILRRGPLGRAIRWDQVDAISLKYYSTRRDRKEGWLHLTVKGAGRRIDLDSTLTGFQPIAERVAAAALARRLPLSDLTRENFASLGISLPRLAPVPGQGAPGGGR